MCFNKITSKLNNNNKNRLTNFLSDVYNVISLSTISGLHYVDMIIILLTISIFKKRSVSLRIVKSPQ